MKTKRQIIFLIGAAVLFGGIILALLMSPATQKNGNKLKIAATIFPLYDIVQNIAGEKAEVILILPAGASPHVFELPPQKAREISGVDLIFKIGVVDDWIDEALKITAGAQLIAVDGNIALKESDEEREEYDPHYWLSPRNGIVMAKNVYHILAETDKINEEYYRFNLDNFIAEIEAVNREIKEQLDNLSRRELIVFHDAWHYFAEEFNLEIVAFFHPSPGKEPTPSYLKNIFDAAKERGLNAIFIEPQLSPESLKPIADDLGLQIFTLDPIGGSSGTDSYVSLLRYNGRVIFEALK